MTQSTKRFLSVAFLGSQPLFMLAVAAFVIVQLTVQSQTVTARTSETLPAAHEVTQATGSDVRSAIRLQKRIEQQFSFTLPLEKAISGIRQQRELFGKHVAVTFAADDGAAIPPIDGSVESFPSWLTVSVTPFGFESSLNVEGLTAHLRDHLPEGIRLPVDASLVSISVEDGVQKAQTDGIAKTGYDFSPDAFAEQLTDAMTSGNAEMIVPLKTVAGSIINTTQNDLGQLSLLATGRSNFEGSGAGRKANVRKGLTQYVQNTVVAQGEEFSMNKILANAPISEWELALGIFDGGELRPVAGGGLCQVATTVYRAALLAGFPIVKRASHSLFVHYYEKYGVGVDATIFPGRQDFRFLNNTNGYLLVQAYVEGDEARVTIYGTPDGRQTTLLGPYFSDSVPQTLDLGGKTLKRNEIAWEQQITFSDGRAEKHTIVSRYKSIPKSVVKKYLHAAAEQKTEDFDTSL